MSICPTKSEEVTVGLFARLWRFGAKLRGLRGEGGSALIELALTMAVFCVPILLGTIDTATLVYSAIEVSDAAHAGAMYGMVSSTYAASASGIRTAAQNNAADFGSDLTVTPTVFYACSSSLTGTHYSTQSAAVAACVGTGNHALEFIQVVASAAVKPGFHFPGLPATVTISDTSVMEVEE